MSGPVIAFDATAARGAKLTRVTRSPKPALPAMSPAELVCTFAGLKGLTLLPGDLQFDSDASDPTPTDMVQILGQQGLTAHQQQMAATAVVTPALVQLPDGHWGLMLSRSDGSATLYDPTAADRRTELPLDQICHDGTLVAVAAYVAPEALTQRHAEKGRKNHWFWGELHKFRRIMGEVALGSFVANLLAVAVALFSLQVYDRVIPHQSTSTLWVLAIGAGLAMLLEAFLRIARARLMDSAGRRIEVRIQSLLMDRLLGMKAGQTAQTPSQTFAAVREFSAIREFFTASTIGTLTDLPFIVLFLALVASIGGNVVWVLFVGGILMVLPSFFLQKKMMALTLATQGASTKSSRLLHEAIYEADTIKALRGEDRFRQVWSELTSLSAHASSEQRKLASTLTFWSQGVQQATYVAAVVVGTFMVFQGQFTVGTIIAVGILTSRTLGPLTGLAATLARWSNVKAALTALDVIAEAAQDNEADRSYLRRPKLKGDYALRDVSYAYDPAGSKTIDIPALDIVAGQRIAVLGSNGSGKSTLLKLLSGLHPPSSGRLLIDGVEMGQVQATDLRRNIGYLGQEVRLFAGTLRDNLNLTMLERDDDRLLAALDFAGLGAFVRDHSKGLDLPIHDGGAGLSIGQRQSIGWARLWLQDPTICLLDEPTAALDVTLERALVARLEKWLQGRTAVIATHRKPILQLTERTMVLQAGRLIVDGPQEQVLAHMNKKAG